MRDGLASAWRPPLSTRGAMAESAADARMPWPYASAVVGAVSVGLWALIWVAVQAVLG